MKHNRELLLKEAPVNKAATSLAVPSIIGMLIGAVYNVVDTFFVGMLNDTSALGATAILFPVFLLITAIGLTFGMGSASVISRKLGEQNKTDAAATASTAFFTTLIIAVVFAVTGNLFIRPILRLFGATDSILKSAEVYGSIIIGGSIFQILNMNMNNMLRAEGAARISGTAIALGGILNIVLDPVFMFILDMGLAGAAAATISAQGISTLFLISYYLRKKAIVEISVKRFCPSFRIYKQIMAIGIPTFLRQSLASLAMAMLANAAGLFGDSAIAAMGIVLRVLSIPMMVLFGFAQGFQPLAGYAYGAKNYKRVREATKFSVKWTTGFALFISFFLFFGAKQVTGLFTNDPLVIQRGIMAMRLQVVIMPFMGFMQIISFLYQALGHAKSTLLLAVARQGLFFIPLVLILPRVFGLTGVYITQTAADALTILISLIMAIRINRELKIMEKDPRTNRNG